MWQLVILINLAIIVMVKGLNTLSEHQKYQKCVLFSVRLKCMHRDGQLFVQFPVQLVWVGGHRLFPYSLLSIRTFIILQHEFHSSQD